MNLFDKATVVHRAWRFRLKAEPGGVRFLRSNLAAGQTCLDIGAHKGAYSWWMARIVGRSGRVFAFEPQAVLADYLGDMRESFGLEQLTVVPKALSSADGERELFIPDGHRGGATLDPKAGEGEVTHVPTVGLDDFLDRAGARPVHFLKCDVEGHELEVFRSGERMLREDRPALLFECQDYRGGGGQTMRVCRYLEDLGYDGVFFERGGRSRSVQEFNPELHQASHETVFLDNFGFRHRA